MIYVLKCIIKFQKARRSLQQKLDCTTLDDKSFYSLSNLSISNNNTLNIDNILHNISKAVDKFW